jgi:group I intron endonuclease
LKNGKSYVGSSVNLRKRLINYYSILNLKAEIKRNKSIIYRSLLRYKHYNFSLEILEYCEPSATISREQYYLDMLKPAYNILKIAASSLGFKHSKNTIAKIKSRLTGRTQTKEHIAKI